MVEHGAPFRHWVIDDWCDPIPRDMIDRHVGPLWEAGYDNDIERGKKTARNLDLMPGPVAAIMERMTNPGSVGHWSRITGITLQADPSNHGGGLHVMDPGGWLGGHVDYAKHPKFPHLERRLNLIAFIHPEWEWHFGGQLLLMDPNGKTVAEINPFPGRLVAFETGDESYHGVRVISPRHGPRVSVAAYMLSAIRPNVTRTRALFFPNRSPEIGKPPYEVR